MQVCLIERPYFTIYIEFSHPAGNELGILGTEIKDDDFFFHKGYINLK